MDRSLFSQLSSGKSRHLSNSSHELPRWRSPSPMAGSIMPPPPIVQSTYISPPRAPTQSVYVEKPSPLEEKQSELEADLQFLLDAQAEGLIRGLEGGLQEDQASNGSTTPTAQSIRSASTRRSARPPRRKPGLKSARKGIYNAILALSAVKDEELSDINDELDGNKRTLEQIEGWETKREGLQEATRRVDANEDNVRVKRLQQEADVLQEEINAVELQLADMKARHRKLVRQASAVENSVQAKMASYTQSLRLLDEEVQKFLSLKPTENIARPTSQDGKTSIWQLPPKRRTLDMAKEQWNEERESIVHKREGVEHEKSALDEGAVVWKDVVAQVNEFEKRLRIEIPKLSNSTTDSEEQANGFSELLASMRQLTQVVESKFEVAKTRNWNLLVAAIGAELDALQQASRMLNDLVGPKESPEELVKDLEKVDSTSSNGEELHDLGKSFATARRRMSNGTESDEPDPELMFSTPNPDAEW